MTFGKVTAVLRTAGLWVLIISDVLMLGWLYVTQNYIWFVVFLVITLWIVLAEVYGLMVGLPHQKADGSLERKKMTISTAYKFYILRVGWLGYVPLVLFWIAMTGLVVHLAFF